MRYPEKEGVFWDSPDYNWDARKSLPKKITNSSVKVTVPAATFDCIEYTTFCENGEIAVIEYYAVNIGLIKCTYYVFGKIGTASILLDYHIK